MTLSNKNAWLIGAGQMAIDYTKVLNKLNIKFDVIGRGKKSSNFFFDKTNKKPFEGGLSKFLETKPKKCDYAIVATNIDQLFDVSVMLIEYGVKYILLEKPGGMNIEEVKSLAQLSSRFNSNVYVAYNRRFYSSTLKAKEFIESDGGVTSFNFEFTEWSNVIESIDINNETKQKWFLANSSHVADLAFFLGGFPSRLTTYTSGSLDWHSSASIFSGAGLSENGAPFSYQANWESAGRWNVEILTKNRRLIFCPMEKLKSQKKGEIAILDMNNINYSDDENFKPGLFKQVKCFLENSQSNLISIQRQLDMVEIYYQMANY